MTYWGFHCRFTLPWMILLGWLAGGQFWNASALAGCGLVLLAVMIFTIPWDNFAAAKGIWGFAEGQFWKKIGYLPVEEYAFFIIQSLMAMFLVAWLTPMLPPAQSLGEPELTDPARLVAMGILLGAWAVIGLAGRKRIHSRSRWHYAWHLGYWFLIVIALQWAIGWEILAPRWLALGIVTLGLGTWLSWADWIAIRNGIWFFDHRQIQGWCLGGKMPWEEAAFFYLTSLLVAQSYLLLVPEALR